MKRIVVAIDGPAGAGKSTVTQRLARALGYQLLDTGALYRLIALAARRGGVAWEDEPGLAGIAKRLGSEVAFEWRGEKNHVLWKGEDVSLEIRTQDMSDGASRVSALPAVRSGLLALQRQLGGGGGVVAEGRDVGTVVFPTAGAKFFLTASPEERARRRRDQLLEQGQPADYSRILAEVIERDERDSGRSLAPLRPADDAITLDSSTMTIDEVVETMRAEVEKRAAQ